MKVPVTSRGFTIFVIVPTPRSCRMSPNGIRLRGFQHGVSQVRLTD